MAPPRSAAPPARRLLVAAAIALSFLGCGRTEAPRETTVRVAHGVDMTGVNELVTGLTIVQTALVYFALFVPLLEEQADYEKGPPTFAPRLAESYEFSPDRKTLTFRLRRDATWSDGVPITAEDVRWTWQAQVHPDVAWSYAYAKERIADVEVVDPQTARFHFPSPTATDLLDAVQGVILPKHAWSKLPFAEWATNVDWFRQNLVVSGPFTLESWEPGQRIVLRKNESYFEPGKPRVDRVVFQIIPERASQLALLRSGGTHFVEFIRPADAQTVLDHPDLQLLTFFPRQNVFVSWNVRNPLFAEREVRQALTMAIDRDAIIGTLQNGYAARSDSPYISNSWVFHRGLAPWPYDPARARELLAEHGFADRDGDGWLERDGKPFRFELVTNADNDVRRDVTVMIQEQLRRVGVDARPRMLELNTLFAKQTSHDFDATLASVGVDTSLDLRYFFHTESIDGGWNWGSYSSPEVDAVIDEIATHLDQVEARPLYERLQELLHRDQPVTYLYEPMRLVGARRTLRNVDPNAISAYFHLRDWTLEEGPGPS